jgi:PAS domain-containing protein
LTNQTMLHPFQGGIPYPWHRPEALALHQLLGRDITNPGQISLLLQSFVPNAPALNQYLAPAELWRQALEAISLADRLLDLCRQLAGDTSFVAVSRAAQAMLDVRPAVERRIGRDQRLVVDREDLRSYLAELGTDSSMVKVLLVRGGPSTGKSWSRHLFERAAEDRGADVVYLDSGIVATVREVVDKLFSTLGDVKLEMVPPTDTTDFAWFRTVCNRMPALAEGRGRSLWIAMDNLGTGPDGVTPLIDVEILGFFQQFVRHFVDPSTSRWFRLLLIHYPDRDDVPTKWDLDVWKEDRTRPDAVTAEHVAEVLREWARDHDRTLLDADIDSASKAVIARADEVLPPQDPRSRQPRLRRIHDEVRAELARLTDTVGVSP